MFNKQEADKLIAMIEGCDKLLAPIEAKKEEYKNKLLSMLSDEVKNSLDGKEYGCGTVTIETDKNQVKVVVSKRVKWDQAKLKDLWFDIESSGEKPEEYIKVKYDVSEEAYKNWPNSIAKAFEPARTVDVSKPSLAIKEKK